MTAAKYPLFSFVSHHCADWSLVVAGDSETVPDYVTRICDGSTWESIDTVWFSSAIVYLDNQPMRLLRTGGREFQTLDGVHSSNRDISKYDLQIKFSSCCGLFVVFNCVALVGSKCFVTAPDGIPYIDFSSSIKDLHADSSHACRTVILRSP